MASFIAARAPPRQHWKRNASDFARRVPDQMAAAIWSRRMPAAQEAARQAAGFCLRPPQKTMPNDTYYVSFPLRIVEIPERSRRRVVRWVRDVPRSFDPRFVLDRCGSRALLSSGTASRSARKRKRFRYSMDAAWAQAPRHDAIAPGQLPVFSSTEMCRWCAYAPAAFDSRARANASDNRAPSAVHVVHPSRD